MNLVRLAVTPIGQVVVQFRDGVNPWRDLPPGMMDFVQIGPVDPDAARFTRKDVIELVREMLGDVESTRSSGYSELHCHRFVRSLRFIFTLGNRDILGEYVVQIPTSILAKVLSDDENPYNTVRCRVDVVGEDVLPPMVQAPPSSPEGS